ncbi:hypothetical protein BGW41_008102 [Actinomortierella wolfii]|nr:hypothetical protein BGW41_008102 [Actinomortierella wolfii]
MLSPSTILGTITIFCFLASVSAVPIEYPSNPQFQTGGDTVQQSPWTQCALKAGQVRDECLGNRVKYAGVDCMQKFANLKADCDRKYPSS